MEQSKESPLVNISASEPQQSYEGLWPTNVKRENGVISIGGVLTTDIVRTYGTPVYVIDEEDMRMRARRWKNAMDDAFSSLAGADVFYAGKAFLSVGVAKWMREEGLGIDTCSLAELVTATKAGYTGEMLGLHGNNKSIEEITYALELGVKHFVIDSLAELDLVARIAQENNMIANVMLRVTTGVHAGGHEYISTAHEDQKFGLSVTTGVARLAIERVLDASSLRLVGLHSHIGSQILNINAFKEAADVVMGLRSQVLHDLNYDIREIDFGGGYAIRYTDIDEVPPTPEEYAHELAKIVRESICQTGASAPHVSIEPGRSIAGPSCVTLYSVGTIKDVAIADEKHRRYVSIDGGMSDNIRPALYGSNYTALRCNRASSEEKEVTRIVGKHCESGDIVVHDLALDKDVQAGDILAVPATGAYGRSMASNYNMLPRPGVIAAKDGQVRWLVRCENVNDLLNLDVDA
ncbi:MAG: diaminopimelate decarboxylase [Actinomycetaceae bacterium]|nr:diaminopimelate decarboxylase [Actinomycetaceae bacterium]